MNEVERLRLELEKAQKQHLAIVNKFASGICSAHQEPDADCQVCNTKLRLPELIESHKQTWREQVRLMVAAVSEAANIRELETLPHVQGEIGQEYLIGVRRGLIIAENIAFTHARTLGL